MAQQVGDGFKRCSLFCQSHGEGPAQHMGAITADDQPRAA
jgi:hypothetical protein